MNSQEVKIDYPCHWKYKTVITTGINLKEVVIEVLDQREFSLKPSNNSKGGKYESHTLTVLVHSDDDRREIFEILKQHKHIKFVL